jgi:hypothetical protein
MDTVHGVAGEARGPRRRRDLLRREQGPLVRLGQSRLRLPRQAAAAEGLRQDQDRSQGQAQGTGRERAARGRERSCGIRATASAPGTGLLAYKAAWAGALPSARQRWKRWPCAAWASPTRPNSVCWVSLPWRTPGALAEPRGLYDLLSDPPLPGIDRLRAIVDSAT